MPKETLHLDDPFQVTIGWHAGSTMQVGVQTHPKDGPEGPARPSLARALYGDQEAKEKVGKALEALWPTTKPYPAQLGELVVQALEQVHPYDGVWATIYQREDANWLIRTMRRARNSVFGKDE